MQLTRKQILELAAALRRLDTFKLSGKTRMQNAQRMRRVNAAVEDIQTAQKGLTVQYGLTGQLKDVKGQQLPVDDPAKTRAHNLEWVAELSESEEYVVGKFLLADLDLQHNNLSVGTLAQMLPIISDLPKVESRSIKIRKLDAMVLAQALARVDSPSDPLKLPYTRKLALADLLVRLSGMADKLEDARQALITEHKLGKHRHNDADYWEAVDTPQELKTFNEAWQLVVRTEIDMDVPVLSSGDLDLDTNNIPGSILADLLLILNDAQE